MKDSWSETLIPGKLASRLIRGKNSVNSTIGRKNFVRVDRGSDLRESDLSEVCSAKNYQHHRDRGILSELGEDPTYASPTYPRFTVYFFLKNINLCHRSKQS